MNTNQIFANTHEHKIVEQGHALRAILGVNFEPVALLEWLEVW